MLDSGTIALMTTALARMSCPCTCPRRERRSPITKPVCSSGVTTSTLMIGSSRTEPPFCRPSRNAAREAISKASAVEQRRLDVDDREAREHARAEHALEALFDARDVLLRHGAADDLRFEHGA